MNKRTKQMALLILAIGLGCWMLAYSRASLSAKPMFRFDLTKQTLSTYGLSRVPIPNKAYLHASVAIDAAGRFYSLAQKRDVEYEKHVSNQHFADSISVLVIDAKGNIKQVIPLKRKDGRYVRVLCEFLTVSPSGKRWWTARRP